MLDGAPIVEFVSDGWGTTENIYIGSQRIASHFVDSGYIQWRHVNPVTGSWVVSSAATGGALANRNELDPLGTEMGTSDPYVSYTSYQDLIGLESLYEERGNPFDPSGGCGTIDGLPASCSEVNMRLRGGSLAAGYEGRERDPSQPLFDPRPPRYIPVLRPIEDYGVGLYGVWVPGGRSRREFRKAGYLFFTASQNISHAEDSTTEDNRTICDRMADDAQAFYDRVKKEYPKARRSWLAQQFNRQYGMHTFGSYFAEGPLGMLGTQASGRDNVLGTRDYQGVSGFPAKFLDTLAPSEDQVHHFRAYFSAGLAGHYGAAKAHRNDDKEMGNFGDVRLGEQSFNLGAYFRNNPGRLNEVGEIIKSVICKGGEVPK